MIIVSCKLGNDGMTRQKNNVIAIAVRVECRVLSSGSNTSSVMEMYEDNVHLNVPQYTVPPSLCCKSVPFYRRLRLLEQSGSIQGNSSLLLRSNKGTLRLPS